MVQLVKKSSSLSIVIVLYLQVFTSPFHRDYQACTDCQTLHDNGGAQNKLYRRHANRTKTGETIIVSDEEPQGNSNQTHETYCDKISKAKYGNHSMYCTDFVQCPAMVKANSEQVRGLTCGIKFDGSIRICCSSASRSVDDAGEQHNSEPFDTFVIGDEEPAKQSNNQRKSKSQLLSRANSSETVVVSDDEPLIKLGSDKHIDEEKGLNQTAIDSRIVAKFPKECGQTKETENVDAIRIIGGEAAKKNAWPWFAILMIQRRAAGRKSPECGATLISDRYVLTAAHCVLEQGKKPLRKERMMIRLGEFNLKEQSDDEEDFLVKQIIPHPRFQSKSFKNDIALLELDRKVRITQLNG